MEQLSHSMSVANIASLAVAKAHVFPWILVKRLIFDTDMLWESCSKYNFTHFLNGDIVLENVSNPSAYKQQKYY